MFFWKKRAAKGAHIDGNNPYSTGEEAHPDAPNATPSERVDVVTPQAVQSELQTFIASHEQRRKQLPRAAVVGVMAGLLGSAFRICLNWIGNQRTLLVLSLHHLGLWAIIFPVLLGIFGSAIAVALVEKVAPETAGSGIPHLKAVLHHLRGMRWERIIPVKFIGGITGIGGGLALGREGPTIQMGAACGKMLSEFLGANPRERQTLIAAGAGAGLAAAFNAPLAGMVFVLEEVQRDFTPIVFGASLIASVMSDVVTRFLTGQDPVFHLRGFPIPPLTALPAFLVVGVLAGFLGVAYNRGLLYSLDLFRLIRKWPPGAGGALVGVLVGLTTWFLPRASGGGYQLLDDVFKGNMIFEALIGFFLLRFVLTMLSYGCGAPGGIFAPLLILGALLGVFVGRGTHWAFPGMAYYPVAFAIVGMGAYFSAIVRAPLTGIVLMLEMTGSYQQMLPLLIACFTAYAVADMMGDHPIYEALMERDLLRGQHVPELKETLLLDLTIQAHSPFEGKPVRELGLPHGCILVSIHRGIEEIVPTADTIIYSADRVTAIISPQAPEAVEVLRKGAGLD